jgi:hypothetical protein
MIKLEKALKAWGTPAFEDTVKEEIAKTDTAQLPLQKGLAHSSYVSDGDISVVVLDVRDTGEVVRLKTGIMYAGIDAGSCCADDPTPVSEQTEYCEVQFDIDKATGDATATLLETA